MKTLHWKKMHSLGGKNYRAENIKECSPWYNGPVVALELFYMSKAKVGSLSWGWTVIRVDAEGNQIGDSWFSCYKDEAIRSANRRMEATLDYRQ